MLTDHSTVHVTFGGGPLWARSRSKPDLSSECGTGGQLGEFSTTVGLVCELQRQQLFVVGGQALVACAVSRQASSLRHVIGISFPNSLCWPVQGKERNRTYGNAFGNSNHFRMGRFATSPSFGAGVHEASLQSSIHHTGTVHDGPRTVQEASVLSYRFVLWESTRCTVVRTGNT